MRMKIYLRTFQANKNRNFEKEIRRNIIPTLSLLLE